MPAHRALSRIRRHTVNLSGPIMVALFVMAMLAAGSVLGGWGALATLAFVPVVAAVARRQSKLKAWQRELEVAFEVHERREVSLSRVL